MAISCIVCANDGKVDLECKLHSRISWSFSSLRRDPVNVLRGTFDVASFTVNAVLSVDLQSVAIADIFRHVFVDAGRTKAGFRTVVDRIVSRQWDVVVLES